MSRRTSGRNTPEEAQVIVFGVGKKRCMRRLSASVELTPLGRSRATKGHYHSIRVEMNLAERHESRPAARPAESLAFRFTGHFGCVDHEREERGGGTKK